jgi:hypothetical protein
MIIVKSLSFASCMAAELPNSLFSIDKVTIGQTTLDEIKSKYGVNIPYRVSKEDESEIEICYSNTESKKKSFLIFESGVMGNNKVITGFRITAITLNKKCSPISLNIRSLDTGNGVYIGQHQKNFIKAFPFSFQNNNSELLYKTVKQRKATEVELKKLRAKWPNEGQDYFDVTIEIKAKFKKDRLIDYYVKKFESY